MNWKLAGRTFGQQTNMFDGLLYKHHPHFTYIFILCSIWNPCQKQKRFHAYSNYVLVHFSYVGHKDKNNPLATHVCNAMMCCSRLPRKCSGHS
jgi:hypothetical protein